uniref:EF-hand domain-containing protein n=1 Tax=Hanusia phi TaxID=3032 RepID=A0A7S0HFP9_9CRYP
MAAVALLICQVQGAQKLGKVPGLDDKTNDYQEQAFNSADKDGDRKLSLNEYKEMLTQAMKSYGSEETLQQRDDKVQELFNKLDKNLDGSIAYDEWQVAVVEGQRKAQEAAAMQAAAQETKLKMVFDAADSNRDEHLDLGELWEGFKAYGYGKEQIDVFFTVGDQDKNGLLNFEEFKVGREGMQKAREMEAMADSLGSEEDQLKAFQDADINQDGSLTLLEYQKAFEDFMAAVAGESSPQAIDSDKIAEMYKGYDTDGSGGVSLEEWKAAVKANMARTQAEREALKTSAQGAI